MFMGDCEERLSMLPVIPIPIPPGRLPLPGELEVKPETLGEAYWNEETGRKGTTMADLLLVPVSVHTECIRLTSCRVLHLLCSLKTSNWA